MPTNPLDQISLYRASPKLRTDWLIPVRERMIGELDRMGLMGPSLPAHPALRDFPGLIHHLIEIGLQESGKPSLLPVAVEKQ